MNSMKKVFILIYDDGKIGLGKNGHSIYTVNLNGNIITRRRKVIKRMKIRDFYRYNGSSIDTLKMLYPEILWDDYQDYFKE